MVGLCEGDNEPPGSLKASKQVVVSIVSSATLLSAGMNLGFSAVSLPHMQDVNGPDRLTVDEGSWFASIGFISTLLGCLTCGPLLDRMGRRRTLLVVNFPFVIGWLLMWVAPKPVPIALLYFARLLNGLGGGMISIPGNIYIAEMSTSSMRCMLVTWPSLAISVGIILVYALGLIITEWRYIAAISTFVPIITTVSIYFYVRESPIWLLARGRVEEAEESFKWIREVDKDDEIPKDLVDEFERIIEKSSTMRERVDNESVDEPGVDMPLYQSSEPCYGIRQVPIATQTQDKVSESVSSPYSTLLRSDVWKPLVILNLYFFFMQFSGVPVLISYAVNIMMSEGVSLEPYLATLLLGIVKLIFEIGAGFVQNRFGRRPLSIASGMGMAACMVGLGLHHQMFTNTEDAEETGLMSWVPLLLIFAYVISAAVGFFLIPWAMLGEVYPTKVAGLACGITTCLGNFFGFASIKLFPTIVVLLGGSANGNSINSTEGVFYFYGGVTAFAVLFIYIYLPETFRRTLQEISDDFTRPSRRLNFI
ncbi:facilitated trehalose transporter Tret1-like isoform X2 [Periplaneta americana]|uniref:facilitated trehalose transporter Tret1-like isoform X2 n=1 Tax=Periplaneta americana TaxID=6978 RepID=UPI0037E98CAE